MYKTLYWSKLSKVSWVNGDMLFSAPSHTLDWHFAELFLHDG